MAEDCSVKDMMETLHAQQELLQKLYTELDMEREATATATNESLSMILRLQGEKAAVEMEGKQYKRIAEHKMVHAEEMLEVFRELIYQKEMQIASLEFQVQAYRFKLMSLGCNDVSEVRRRNSLPPYFFKDSDEPLIDGEVCESNVKAFSETNGDFSSYWEKIRSLDEQVKRLSNSADLSVLSHDPVTPVKVQDIFEVPQTPNDDEIADLPPEDEIYPVTPDAIKAVISDDIDKNSWDRRINMSPDISNTFAKPRDGLAIEHMYFARPDVTDFELQQMNRRLKRLEDERIVVRQEITVEKDDNSTLLLDIKDQLNSIEVEIKQWKPKKAPPKKKEADLTTLTEAMLHFWL